MLLEQLRNVRGDISIKEVSDATMIRAQVWMTAGYVDLGAHIGSDVLGESPTDVWSLPCRTLWTRCKAWA